MYVSTYALFCPTKFQKIPPKTFIKPHKQLYEPQIKLINTNFQRYLILSTTKLPHFFINLALNCLLCTLNKEFFDCEKECQTKHKDIWAIQINTILARHVEKTDELTLVVWVNFGSIKSGPVITRWRHSDTLLWTWKNYEYLFNKIKFLGYK